MAEPPAKRFVTPFADSRRWRSIVRRPGDVVVSTPDGPVARWAIELVRGVLHGAPASWIESLDADLADLVASLEDLTGRRVLVSHSPGDCVPFDAACRYVVAYEAASPKEIAAQLRSHGEAPTPVCSPARHLASWWPRRHRPHVCFVHENDVRSDVVAEARRIERFLGADPLSEDWMRALGQVVLDLLPVAEPPRPGDADEPGLAGDERGLLPAEPRAWMARGSTGYGAYPDQIGSAAPSAPRPARSHPVYNRLGQRPASSLDAIAERRVAEARAAGLFDDLELTGKPIPDLDRPRRPGWWAEQFVATERNKVKAMELEAEIRAAMPALWRHQDEAGVIAAVVELNDRIDLYNRRTTVSPMPRLDPTKTLATWRRLRAR